ncbi:hypothetical protein ACHAXT_010641 [Thalassiosira profunda]
MRLPHPHHRAGGGGGGHAKDTTQDAHASQPHRPPRPCYHCGREFLNCKGGLVTRLKHGRDHCPACHSRLDLGAVETSQHEKEKQSQRRLHVPSFVKRSLARKKASSMHAKKLKTERTSRTPAGSSFESTASECEANGTADDRAVTKESEPPIAKRADSCPFAFTYETEEVESYQISHEDTTQEIESYQMEWLLFDAP